MKNNKKILIILLAALFLLLLGITCYSFSVDVKVEEQTYAGGVTIKITSDEEMQQVKIYKKVSDKYILFYIGNAESKELTVKIPNSTLSTESETDIIVVATNKDGETGKSGTTVDKVKPRVSINPEETEKPSWSPSTLPTKPTPSSSTTTSPSSSDVSTPDASSGTSDSGDGVEPTDISLNMSELTLTLGENETAKLTYTVTPPEARSKLTWRTNAADIATIDKDGNVKAVSVGTTEISIRTANGKSATCVVKVVRKVGEYGEALARGACELAYSNYHDNNGHALVNSNGYYGTEKYRKYRNDGNKPHGCCSRGMASVINGYLKFDTSLEYTGAKEQYHYMAGSDKWKKIGTYHSGMEEKSDSLLEPGDIVISTHHTCMYVGNQIPKEVYEESLKGTDGDYGVPKDSAVWVSGGWTAGVSLCICNRDEAHPSSGDGIIYRYVGND